MSQNNLKLLTEWYPLTYKPELIKEAMSSSDGKVTLRGVLQRCDTLNQNGRIYPKSILEREILNYSNAPHIKN